MIACVMVLNTDNSAKFLKFGFVILTQSLIRLVKLNL